jgi:hypothetical protein
MMTEEVETKSKLVPILIGCGVLTLLMVVAVPVVLIVGLTVLGNHLESSFDDVSRQIEAAP